MTSQANVENPVTEVDASQVHDYLSNHLDFFDSHHELLTELQLSHTSGSAVSLIERQVQTLRNQNRDLKKRLRELVDVARDNDRLSERLHKLTLELISIHSLTEFIDKLEHQLCSEFSADAIIAYLPGLNESQQRGTNARPLVINDELKALLPIPLLENQPQCGRLKQAQSEFLFGEYATTFKSSAIIPLGKNGQNGLLTIGSREASHFIPCMGTLFLNHLGELVTSLLKNLDNH